MKTLIHASVILTVVSTATIAAQPATDAPKASSTRLQCDSEKRFDWNAYHVTQTATLLDVDQAVKASVQSNYWHVVDTVTATFTRADNTTFVYGFTGVGDISPVEQAKKIVVSARSGTTGEATVEFCLHSYPSEHSEKLRPKQ